MEPFKRPWLATLLALALFALGSQFAYCTPYYGASTLGGPSDSSTVFMSGDFRVNDPKIRTETVSSTSNPGLEFRTTRSTSPGQEVPNEVWSPRNPHGRWVGPERNLAPDQMEANPMDMGTIVFSEEFFLEGDGTYTFQGELLIGTSGTWVEVYINGVKVEVDISKCTKEKAECIIDLSKYAHLGVNKIEIRTDGAKALWAGIIAPKNKDASEVPEPRTVHLIAAGVLALVLVKYLRWRNFRVTSRR